ncbi:MAG TPA: TAT-variant-translocated molybdopterin oxidoreductase, partial [Bryobacteraceae bacterium]|nr:TAT-variant-translocated molybdopterin oxidoreductase [Bryobacteraceae bacterium]
MSAKPRTFDISEIRKKLESRQGPQYWRSLEEIAGTKEFQEYLHREFPENASEWLDGVSRRGFLKVMGASLALAGLSACTKQPVEYIVPYVRQPEEIIPGRPLFYASALTLGGYAQGVLVESNMGRPTKVEGNPDHPASLGATTIYSQAATLGLYDPDRSQSIMNLGSISLWSDFLGVLQARMAVEKGRPVPGSGLRILTETMTSPTLTGQLKDLLAAYPGAKWIQYEPAGRDEARKGAQMAFGQYVECHYKMDRADVVVALESDLLGGGPGQLRYVRDFMARRRGEA